MLYLNVQSSSTLTAKYRLNTIIVLLVLKAKKKKNTQNY